ncbi:MAG: transcriptional repressor [Labilithrix sp.]|nr:transcriptional repressor [Labilithrix sp.]
MATKRQKKEATSLAELQGLLRGAGLRSTGPRVAVLRDLLGRAAPASHADLCDALRRDGFDRATLYRNLIDLADAGIVSRVDLGDHVWRFEVKRRKGDHVANHPHFVCSACGVVSCLPDVAVRITRGPSAPRSLASKDVAIQLTALCDACV